MSQWAIQKHGEPRSARRRMSVAEWALLPDGEPGELVDGRLVEEEVASGVHELIVGWLIFVLTGWVDAREGFVFGSDLKFAVAPEQGRKPDVTVFFAGSPLPPAEGVVEVPPDIAVEVVSPSPKDDRRDRVEKPDEYAAFGVRWYWIVDPQLRSLEIHARGADGRYALALAATAGVIEAVPGCEGLRLDLGRLWARVDRLVATKSG
jgi:Uma2 family endonuclease